MTAAGVVDANTKVLAFIAARYPWLRPPHVIEDPYTPDTTQYHVTDSSDGYYDLLIPRWWDEHRRDLLIHEVGHVLAYFCGRTRDVIREWLLAMGGSADIENHRLRGEMFAEHFVRAEVPEYTGSSYPQLVGLVPFDAAKMRAFCEGLAPVSPPILPPIQRAIEWSGPVPDSNFARGRSGYPISLIVDHWMATTFDGAMAHFMNGAAGVSAHYLISQQGRIVQVVRDEDTAYHAGNWSVNQQSIGIEHEGGPNLPPFTPELYAASAWLHHKLSLDYGIRLVVGESVEPHRAITPTQCPGTLDLDRIVREAGGTEDMTREEVIALIEERWGLTNTIAAMKATYDPLVPQAHPKTHEHTLEGKAK